MAKYVLSEDADRDLDGIWDYIAEDNIDAADQWIGRLFEAFDAEKLRANGRLRRTGGFRPKGVET